MYDMVYDEGAVVPKVEKEEITSSLTPSRARGLEGVINRVYTSREKVIIS